MSIKSRFTQGRFFTLRSFETAYDRLRGEEPGHPCFEWSVATGSRTSFPPDVQNTNDPVTVTARVT